MSSNNVEEWIHRSRCLIGDKVLEVGSRQYQQHSTIEIRAKFCEAADVYIGCDIEHGKNVDLLVDITKDFSVVDHAFRRQRFDTIFCISVLEHIPDVFAAARNLSKLLERGGHIFLSVPFVFRFHGYPGDYWRFTPEGLMHLFPDLEMSLEAKTSMISTLEDGDLIRLPGDFRQRNKFLFRPKDFEYKLRRKAQKKDRLSGNESVVVDPYFLAPSMINMIGAKRTENV